MWQTTNTVVDDDGKMLAVANVPPPGELVYLRERGAAYPVEVLSKRAAPGGGTRRPSSRRGAFDTI